VDRIATARNADTANNSVVTAGRLAKTRRLCKDKNLRSRKIGQSRGHCEKRETLRKRKLRLSIVKVLALHLHPTFGLKPSQ